MATIRAMMDNDPLWKLRHALLGLAAALLVSMFIAAALGAWWGDWMGGTYGWRAGAYAALLLYVVVGAVVLFAKVARFETQRVSLSRVARWTASLWLWPLLLLASRQARERR